MLDMLTTSSTAAPLALPDLIALPQHTLENAAIKGLLFPFDGLTSLMEDADWYEFANPARADRDASGQIRSYFPNQATGSLVRRTMDVGSGVLGFPWFVDVQFYYEECENTVHVHMKNHFCVAKIPDRAFCPGDTHNYCILADAKCDVITCQDLC